MPALDRLLTIVITATLTSAFWIVAGSTLIDRARVRSGVAPQVVPLRAMRRHPVPVASGIARLIPRGNTRG